MSQTQTDNNWWHDPLKVFVKVSAWVATPVVIALFVGKYFDEKYHTTPWIFLATTGIAFIFSCYGIIRETKKYMQDITSTHIDDRSTDN